MLAGFIHDNVTYAGDTVAYMQFGAIILPQYLLPFSSTSYGNVPTTVVNTVFFRLQAMVAASMVRRRWLAA